jgi:hypothetical protein
VRNSSLVKWLCAENVTGLSLSPKLRPYWKLDVRGLKLERMRMNDSKLPRPGSIQEVL